MNKRRIFVAIDLPDQARERVFSYMKMLQEEYRYLRIGWEKPEKLHITLKFAGDLDENQLSALSTRVKLAGEGIEPFKISVTGTGAFTRRKSRAGVLWLGLISGGMIESLAGQIDATNAPKRPFSPHLTLARLRKPKGSRELISRHLNSTFSPVEFHAREIIIYESTLLPAGSVYSVIGKYPLN